MATSYNGWPASADKNEIGVVKFGDAHGFPFPGGVKSGDVFTVLGYVATQLHNRVEPCIGGWCWGYTYKANVNNPSQLSCHASATAIDWNAPDHPNGSSGTFTDAQRGTIYAILNEVEGVVGWLEGYDEMHFEIQVSAADLAPVAARLGGGTGPAPIPQPDDEDDEMLKLCKGDTGNGATFGYGPGRFFHVPSPHHITTGVNCGLWTGDVQVISTDDLDVLRDNCVGNGEGKGDNLVTTLPSAIAKG